jgi:hypothetical protein
MAKIIKIPSAYVMDTKVVGVSKENSDGTSRQQIIAREVLENDPIQLELEPDNPFDPNAVKVLSKFGHQIGYLGRDVAERVRMALLNEVDVTAKASWVSGDKMMGVGLRIEMVN